MERPPFAARRTGVRSCKCDSAVAFAQPHSQANRGRSPASRVHPRTSMNRVLSSTVGSWPGVVLNRASAASVAPTLGCDSLVSAWASRTRRFAVGMDRRVGSGLRPAQNLEGDASIQVGSPAGERRQDGAELRGDYNAVRRFHGGPPSRDSRTLSGARNEPRPSRSTRQSPISIPSFARVPRAACPRAGPGGSQTDKSPGRISGTFGRPRQLTRSLYAAPAPHDAHSCDRSSPRGLDPDSDHDRSRFRTI